MALASVTIDQPLCLCTEGAQCHIALQILTSCSTSTKGTSSLSTHRPASTCLHQELLPHQGCQHSHQQTRILSSMATPLAQLLQVISLMLLGAANLVLNIYCFHVVSTCILMAASSHLEVVYGQQVPFMLLQDASALCPDEASACSAGLS